LNLRKLLILLALIGLVAAFFALDLGRFLSLEDFKSRQQALYAAREASPLQSAAVFFLFYVLVTGLSLPGATVLTVASGAIFGLAMGTLLSSFGSAVGACLAFLSSRYLLRDWVQLHWGQRLAAINRGVERDGAFYLLTLRLVPAFPFFLVNLVMGLTPIRLSTFYWVSQLGMLAGTVIYVNAGRELARIDSLGAILSPRMLLALALLGLLPLLARALLGWVRNRRVYAGWTRPRRFDRNIVVIGAGSAGLVTSYIAAAVRARVTLIEKHKMGGDCLNTGCVPSKALIRSAKLAHQLSQAGEFGLEVGSVKVDFGAVMERIQRVIQTVEPHDSVERYTKLGVDCLEGEARIVSPWSVEIKTSEGTQSLTARNIVISAGARPAVPAIAGLAEIGYWTSDTIWNLRKLPGRLLVLGAGPIGCELAQCFARFGSKVVQVDRGGQLLSREDAEISRRLAHRFQTEGIELLFDHQPQEFRLVEGRKLLVCMHAGQRVELEFDELLVCLGRTANTEGYGLEELGIGLSPSKTVAVNEFLETKYPNILACGDVAGPYQFTHVAAHQAWFAAVNSLFGDFRKFAVDYSVIPWCTFTDPEVARVGLNEKDADRLGVAYEVTNYDLQDLDRAIADGAAEGVVKVLTVPGKDKILGVTIVGQHAGDLLAEYVLAMRHGLGLNQILSTIHSYPTWAEANKFAAGEWKKNHKPELVLSWLERFHSWRRG
jgi:pyruvate/2-oxoglutarate dehydrogenase complex dihydrolipoamide dehydrogenase (E3) component/uncharacterized membrane protein YdjX (TVP38/TMEM64 family)